VYRLFSSQPVSSLADSGSEQLTAFGRDESDGGTWRTIVLGVEYADLCSDVAERPEIVHVARVDVSPETTRRRRCRPAGTWFAVNNAMFSHRLHPFSRLPELNLHGQSPAQLT